MKKKTKKVVRPEVKPIVRYNVAKLPQRIKMAVVVYGD